MVNLVINGRKLAIDVEPDMPLLWALRDELGMVGHEVRLRRRAVRRLHRA